MMRNLFIIKQIAIKVIRVVTKVLSSMRRVSSDQVPDPLLISGIENDEGEGYLGTLRPSEHSTFIRLYRTK